MLLYFKFNLIKVAKMSINNYYYFSSECDIINYLESHPLTNKESLPSSLWQKIANAVAVAFANQKRTSIGIKISVAIELSDIKAEINFSQDPNQIIANFSKALEDFATENKNKLRLSSENKGRYTPI